MSTTTIVLPDGIEWVALGLFSTQLLLMGQTVVVSKHRKAAKIPYPQLYAEKAEAEASKEAFAFNCAQRAHQNTLEYMPVVLISTLITSVKYPIYAASAVGLFVVGRVFYTRGYLREPKLRGKGGGAISSYASIALMLGSAWTAFELVKGRLGF